MKTKAVHLAGLFVWAALNALQAQIDFRPGYVVMNNGDTLHGQINYGPDKRMHETCIFREPDNRAAQQFTPTQVQAYRIHNGKYYVSKTPAGKTVFLEYLIKGAVSIYYMRDSDGTHYYIEKEGLPLHEITQQTAMLNIDGKSYRPPASRRNQVLHYYMRDSEKALQRIQHLQQPGEYNLVKLAEAYHNDVAKDQPYTIYKQQLPLVQLSLEPVFGLIKYREHQDFFHEYGWYIHLSSPRASDVLYFKTGFLYNHLVYPEEKSRVYRYPLQFEYIYPSGKFRPKAAAGVNLYYYHFIDANNSTIYDNAYIYSGFNHFISFSAGINYQITQRISASLNVDTEYPPVNNVWIGKRSNDWPNIHFRQITYAFGLGLFIEI